jgi:hypothetical protein
MQLNELVPQPLLSVAAEAGRRAVLLLDTLSVSSFAPLRESAAVETELPADILSLPPDVKRTVGGGGFVTVTVKLVAAERPAPSTAVRLRCAVPTCPRAGVINIVQELVAVPQEAGSNCVAADAPNATSAVLSLLPERVSVPVPARVNGSCPELPPTMEMLLPALTAGEGRLWSAPSASTRP